MQHKGERQFQRNLVNEQFNEFDHKQAKLNKELKILQVQQLKLKERKSLT